MESDSADSRAQSDYCLTASEARARGIDCDKAPAPETCPFCGKALEHSGLLSPLATDEPRIAIWFENTEDCECAEYMQAKAERIVAEEREREERELREAQERVQKRLLRSNIKPRFLTRTFDAFNETDENSRPLKMAHKYVATFDERKREGMGLYFIGPVGTGKTHLAVAVAIDLIGRGVPALFTTSPDLLDSIRETYSAKTSQEEVITPYRSTELLVLDDLGKESPSDWTCSILFSLINDRYESMLPTIVTTQYDDEELCRRLAKAGDIKTAEALVSRLREVCYPVDMQGPDWRNGEEHEHQHRMRHREPYPRSRA